MSQAGPLMVVLSGGAATFNPASVAGCVGFYDFADASSLFTDTGRTTAVSADGNAIAGVTDKSGSANHLAQGTGASQPTYKVSALGGRSVARFDGGDFISATYGVALNQPGTVFVVGTNTDRGVDSWAVSGTNGAPGWIVHRVNGVPDHWGLYSGSVIAGAATADASAHILAAVVNNASSKLYKDGGAADASGTTGANTLVACSIGANTSGANGIIGDVGEVLVYNAALSLANINLIGAYLGGKYGLTWTTAT